ncbi:hypothetical protein RQP46_007899 [Phenoliferia psychrophenolica]
MHIVHPSHEGRLSSANPFLPAYDITLHYAEPHYAQSSHYTAAIEWEFYLPALVIGDHPEINSLRCDSVGDHLTFSRKADYLTATSWTYPMLLVVDGNDGGCNFDTDGMEHYHLIHAISERSLFDNPKFELIADQNWDKKKGVKTKSIDIFSISTNYIPLTAADKKARKGYARGTGKVSLACVNCYAAGDLTLTIDTGSALANLVVNVITGVLTAGIEVARAVSAAVEAVATKVATVVKAAANVATTAISKAMTFAETEIANGAVSAAKSIAVAAKTVEAESKKVLAAVTNFLSPSPAAPPAVQKVQVQVQATVVKAVQVFTTVAKSAISGLRKLFGKKRDFTVGYAKVLVAVGIPVLSIPDVVIVASGAATLNGSITRTVGIDANFPDINIGVNLNRTDRAQHFSRPSANLHPPTTELDYASITVGAYLEPQYLVGINFALANRQLAAGFGLKFGLVNEFSVGTNKECDQGLNYLLDFQTDLSAIYYSPLAGGKLNTIAEPERLKIASAEPVKIYEQCFDLSGFLCDPGQTLSGVFTNGAPDFSNGRGGRGCALSGIIEQPGTLIYLAVGQEAGGAYDGYGFAGPCFGGGGGGGYSGSSYLHSGAGGGGATSIRTISASQNAAASTNSRLLVAGGGGGAVPGSNGGDCGHAGAVTGGSTTPATQGTLSSGGAAGFGGAVAGSPGVLGAGGGGANFGGAECGGGGGGGFYGGGGGTSGVDGDYVGQGSGGAGSSSDESAVATNAPASILITFPYKGVCSEQQQQNA